MRKVLLSILMFVGMTNILLAYNVTFKVDMANVSGFTVANVNGNLNGWCGSCAPMTDDNNDGIWELTIDLLPGTYEYKFTADGWNQQENLTPGSACTVTNFGFTNRSLTVVDADIVLPVVCWGSCTTCTSVYPVTFKVDMSTVTASYTQPTVNGMFNGWSGNANPLTDANNDGIWETTIYLSAGTYEYKFAADNWGIQENLIPGSTCTVTNSGFTNRTVTVSNAAVVLDPICWGACVACSQVAPSYNVTFQVDMNQQTGYTIPELNGTFNNWCGNCAQMSDSNNDGIYDITVQLQAGTYEYKFSHDNWGGSEQLTAGSSCTVTNGGFTNRSLTVTGNTVLSPVCYASCNACTAPTYNVTFQVDMSQQPGIVPELNGTFNNWCGDCTPMTDANNDGVYEVTVALQSGNYEYKFAWGNWSGSESLTAGSSCTVTNGGYTNRSLVVGTAAMTIPVVCYGSCTTCSPPLYNITFQVDMSQQSGFTAADVNGTFNGWCGSCNAMTDANNDGVWTVTIPLAAGTYEYKFTTDGWGGQENLIPGSPCTVTNSGFTNRSLNVTADATIAVVCYGSCSACSGGGGNVLGCTNVNATNYNQAATIDDGSCLYNVKFQVDMANQTGFTTPEVNGTFNGWCGSCNAMTDSNNDGVWEVTIALAAGSYEYKFSADGWGSQENLVQGSPCTVTNGGYTNRSLVVGTANAIIPVVCWGSCNNCSAPTYSVTFQVDMTQTTGFTTPEVNGSFNGWCGNCNPLTDANSDGIWETTVNLGAGTYEYKFSADGWGIQESLTAGTPCTVTNYGFTNRSLVVTNANVVVPVVCWNSCSACAPPTRNITFQVDMSQQTGFTTPEVNGSFNNWCGSCNPMTDANNDGIWEVTLPIPVGSYEYKFTADAWGSQENLAPGSSCTVTNYGFTNRALTVGSTDQTLPVVCWGSCTTCTQLYNVTFQVDMNQQSGFTTPEVNGSFNGWCGSCNAMSDANNDGVWEVTVALPAGTYEYKYSADGWGSQESLTPGSSCTVSNYGFTNRTLTVGNTAQTLPVVCWGSCSICSAPSYNITFRVDMSQTTGFTTPEVNGTFNGWCGNCSAMTDANNDGVWEITIPLQSGTYEYKFSADGWGIQEALTAGSSCTVTNFGFTNRSLVVNGASQTLDIVCWNSCAACCQNLSYYADNDGDGEGAGAVQILCAVPTSGYSLTALDCNDNSAAINPSATEICGNLIDENCDGIMGICGDDYAAATTLANIGQYGTGTQSTTTVNLITATNSVQSPGTGNDMWYNFVATGNAVRISLKGATGVADDNAIGLYNYSAGAMNQMIPIATENDVTTAAMGVSTDAGNEILYYSNLVVGNTYSINISNQNSTPGIVIMTVSYLRGSQIDIGAYTGYTNSYTNVCQNFKAAFRSGGTSYIVRRWSSAVASGTPIWSYTIPSGTVCQLGKIAPANFTGANQSLYVSVDVVYNMADAFGNANTINAVGTAVGTFTLQSEASLFVRTSDQCPVFKSVSSSVATNRSVCGVATYGWEFTQVFPAPGLPTALNGAAGASRILPLAAVAGISNGQRYDVRIRANHLDGVSSTAYSANNSCVKTIGASGMPIEDNGDVMSNVHLNGANISVFPNPNSGNGIQVSINGMDGAVKVELMDATGRLVTQEQWVVEGALNQTMNFNSTLPVGMYSIRFTQGSYAESLKFIVTR